MDITPKIKAFIIKEFLRGKENYDIDPETSLIQTGLLDSLALLRLVGFIEDEFGLLIDDEDINPENFDSLKSIETFLVGK